MRIEVLTNKVTAAIFESQRLVWSSDLARRFFLIGNLVSHIEFSVRNRYYIITSPRSGCKTQRGVLIGANS